MFYQHALKMDTQEINYNLYVANKIARDIYSYFVINVPLATLIS